MKLENFHPAGNQVLAEVKYHKKSPGGILYQQPKQDMFAKILAVGNAVKSIEVGKFVMFQDAQMLQIPLTRGKERLVCVLTTEFNILATYTPSKGETRIFTADEEDEVVEDNGIKIEGDNMGEWAQEKPEIFKN